MKWVSTIHLCLLCTAHYGKESLMILKGWSEAVNQRTDNTMAKRKKTKGKTTIYKTLQVSFDNMHQLNRFFFFLRNCILL
jgi:hypothetical protein